MTASPPSCDALIFFVRAGDGIRGKLVTGVQTCALPICQRPGQPRAPGLLPPQRLRSYGALQYRGSGAGVDSPLGQNPIWGFEKEWQSSRKRHTGVKDRKSVV